MCKIWGIARLKDVKRGEVFYCGGGGGCGDVWAKYDCEYVCKVQKNCDCVVNEEKIVYICRVTIETHVINRLTLELYEDRTAAT